MFLGSGKNLHSERDLNPFSHVCTVKLHNREADRWPRCENLELKYEIQSTELFKTKA